MLSRAATVAIAIAFAAPVGASAQETATRHQPRGINAREHQQVQRMQDGVKDRELTKAELDRLRADEAAIQRRSACIDNRATG